MAVRTPAFWLDRYQQDLAAQLAPSGIALPSCAANLASYLLELSWATPACLAASPAQLAASALYLSLQVHATPAAGWCHCVR